MSECLEQRFVSFSILIFFFNFIWHFWCCCLQWMHACYKPLPCDNCTGRLDVHEVIFVNETVYGYNCPNNTVELASGPCLESVNCQPATLYAPTFGNVATMDHARFGGQVSKTISTSFFL